MIIERTSCSDENHDMQLNEKQVQHFKSTTSTTKKGRNKPYSERVCQV